MIRLFFLEQDQPQDLPGEENRLERWLKKAASGLRNIPEHSSTYTVYQASFVLLGENGGAVPSISGPPNVVGSPGHLALESR